MRPTTFRAPLSSTKARATTGSLSIYCPVVSSALSNRAIRAFGPDELDSVGDGKSERIYIPLPRVYGHRYQVPSHTRVMRYSRFVAGAEYVALFVCRTAAATLFQTPKPNSRL